MALAGDTPPPTLPKGFLEGLPVMEKLNDDEFHAFLLFVSTTPPPAQPQPPAAKGVSSNNREGVTDGK